ncbi:MFS transporter [Herbidospora mongoliensis]|uniref:MFS transporter n=1 Tax=Herbidospora mongoliensis TaxID=688067 RepID=UPI00082BFA8C|nr:MFS transporter [Herbidospora mongoliensis]
MTSTGLWRQPDFRNLWLGQTSSMFAANMIAVMLPLLATQLLDASVFEVGVLAAAGHLPYLLISLFAGVWLDRRPKRPTVALADALRAVLLVAIPVGWWQEWLSVPLLAALAFLIGVCSVVSDIGSASLLPFLVDRDDLIEGNSKLELSASASSIGGHAIAGAAFQFLTGPVAMVVNSVLFALSALFTGLIRKKEEPAEVEEGQSIWTDMAEGIRFVIGHVTVRTLILATLIVNFFTALAEPASLTFVTKTLGIAPVWVGVIFASSGAGALLGAMLAGPISARLPLGRLLILTSAVAALASLLTPLATFMPVPVAVALLVVMYTVDAAVIVVYNINVRAYRAAITPDAYQGRMNAAARMAVLSLVPVGVLLGGGLGMLVGVPWALALASLGMFLSTVVLAASHIRRVERIPDLEPREPVADVVREEG